CSVSGFTHFAPETVRDSTSMRAEQRERTCRPMSMARKVRMRDMVSSSTTGDETSPLIDGAKRRRSPWPLPLRALSGQGLVPVFAGAVVQPSPELSDHLHGQVVRAAGRLLRGHLVSDAVQEGTGQHVAGPGQVYRLRREGGDVGGRLAV